MKIVGENYRDETRLEHMLAALFRIQATASNVSRDQLFLDDVVTRALMYDFTVLGEAAEFKGDCPHNCLTILDSSPQKRARCWLKAVSGC